MKTLRLAMFVTASATFVGVAGLLGGLAAPQDPTPGIAGIAPVSALAKPTLTSLPPKPRPNTSVGWALHRGSGYRTPPTDSGRAAWQHNGNGPIYTWRDGDRTMRVILQQDLTVQRTGNKETPDTVTKTRSGERIVRKQIKPDTNPLPVFRSESGNTLMTLPGGVLLVLDPDWEQHAIVRFFSDNQVELSSVTEIDFLNNAFLVPTEPGFPSLALANRLAELPGVVSSSPNWWRDLSRE